MPELPEVESVRRGLQGLRLRAPICDVWRSDKPLRTGAHWRNERLDRLVGARPGAVSRRGKFLVWAMHRGGEPWGWLLHLGMTGRLELHRDPPRPHTHVIATFEDGRSLRFVDPRRFGGMRVAPLSELFDQPPLVDMGPEPLAEGFDGALLQARARDSKRVLREVLTDQRVVAGVGNIYALEALFRAGLHPLLAAHRLRPSAWARLADALVDVLQQGLDNGGTTFRDFRGADGEPGRNQALLQVYGRAGQPCVTCGAVLSGFVHAGRGGVFCPHDQPRPRGRWVR